MIIIFVKCLFVYFEIVVVMTRYIAKQLFISFIEFFSQKIISFQISIANFFFLHRSSFHQIIIYYITSKTSHTTTTMTKKNVVSKYSRRKTNTIFKINKIYLYDEFIFESFNYYFQNIQSFDENDIFLFHV